MRRQYRFVACPGCSGRSPRKMLARSLLLGLACVVSVMSLGPAAVSAARQPTAPEPLLEEFPLNPTGERIVSPPSARPGVGVLRPPVASDARSTASGTSPLFLAAVGGAGIVVLLGALILAPVLLRSATKESTAPGHEKPSAHISAVFIGTRRLPIIEGLARQKARLRWTTATARVLVACAIAAVVALLIAQYVG